MQDISPIPSNIQLFGSSATDPLNRRPGKVVMISSHPEWPGRRELRGGDDGEIAADTVHLTRVFYEVLERVKQGPVLNMDDESVTIGHMIDLIWSRFTPEDGTIPLSRILRHARSERAVICMFLALLELLRLEAIVLRQDRHCADILLRKNSALTG
jgi:segregation and condensation protein A